MEVKYFSDSRRENTKMRKINGAKWFVVAVLICIVTIAVAAYTFETIKFPVEVKEPLSVVAYPEFLSLYPNTTEYFNITVENVASVNYLVAFAFSLNDTAYQQAYATFSDETYTVTPGLNNLTAYIRLSADAPPTQLELTVELSRVSEFKPAIIHLSSFHYEWLVERPSWIGENYTQFLDMSFDVIPTLTGADLRITIKGTAFNLSGEPLGPYPSLLYLLFDYDGDGDFYPAEPALLLPADNNTYPAWATNDSLVTASTIRKSPFHIFYEEGNYAVWIVTLHLTDSTTIQWQANLALKNDLMVFSDVYYYHGIIHFDPQHKLATRWSP